jgi:hypothetical protein
LATGVAPIQPNPAGQPGQTTGLVASGIETAKPYVQSAQAAVQPHIDAVTNAVQPHIENAKQTAANVANSAQVSTAAFTFF